jgi:hypothetical protein
MNLRVQVELLFDIALQASSVPRHAHHAKSQLTLGIALAQPTLDPSQTTQGAAQGS